MVDWSLRGEYELDRRLDESLRRAIVSDELHRLLSMKSRGAKVGWTSSGAE